MRKKNGGTLDKTSTLNYCKVTEVKCHDCGHKLDMLVFCRVCASNRSKEHGH